MKPKFQCEACKKLWDTAPEAEACEKSHVHLASSDTMFSVIEHYYDGERYPHTVSLHSSGGFSITYKQERRQPI